MNQPIGLTPNDLIAILLWVCGAIISISSATAIIIKLVQKAKQPERNQDKRIEELERLVKRHEQLFNNDNTRLNELEEGNRVTQQALLALLSHSINGNDTDKLTKARDDLQQYLILRGGVHNA